MRVGKYIRRAMPFRRDSSKESKAAKQRQWESLSEHTIWANSAPPHQSAKRYL